VGTIHDGVGVDAVSSAPGRRAPLVLRGWPTSAAFGVAEMKPVLVRRPWNLIVSASRAGSTVNNLHESPTDTLKIAMLYQMPLGREGRPNISGWGDVGPGGCEQVLQHPEEIDAFFSVLRKSRVGEGSSTTALVTTPGRRNASSAFVMTPSSGSSLRLDCMSPAQPGGMSSYSTCSSGYR
jgi:hypothetical protein